jgi:protein-S-isoprenylcysteine O-methyltransferase Ste14
MYSHRGVMVAPPLVLALVLRGEREYGMLIWLIGLIVFALGMGIRIWAQEHLHYRLKMHRQLTDTGPYQLVRNPIYWGNTLICVGCAIVSRVLWLAPVELVWCAVVYYFVVRSEEAVLKERYGQEYLDYLEQVPRWFPKKLNLNNLGIINRHIFSSIIAELHCLLWLVPYIGKEIFVLWVKVS